MLSEWYRTERAVLTEYLSAYMVEGGDGTPQDVHHAAGPARGRARHPSHRLLTEVTGAIIREDISESPLLVSVKLIEQITRASVETSKARARSPTSSTPRPWWP